VVFGVCAVAAFDDAAMNRLQISVATFGKKP
jgi:hypothetical protein